MKNFLKPTKVTWIAIALMVLAPLTIPVPFVGLVGGMIFIWAVLFIPGILHMILGNILDEKGVVFISIGVIADSILVYLTASIISWVWYKIKKGNTIVESAANEE